MPNFKLLLKTFKEVQLAKALNDIGIKSCKLLFLDNTRISDFTVALPPPVGRDFIVFVDPEDGITHYDIKKLDQKIMSILEKMKEFHIFSIETKDSFKAKYLSRKLLTEDAIEEILKKADTLDNLYDKVFGVNKADVTLPATAAAADSAAVLSAAASTLSS